MLPGEFFWNLISQAGRLIWTPFGSFPEAVRCRGAYHGGPGNLLRPRLIEAIFLGAKIEALKECYVSWRSTIAFAAAWAALFLEEPSAWAEQMSPKRTSTVNKSAISRAAALIRRRIRHCAGHTDLRTC